MNQFNQSSTPAEISFNPDLFDTTDFIALDDALMVPRLSDIKVDSINHADETVAEATLITPEPTVHDSKKGLYAVAGVAIAGIAMSFVGTNVATAETGERTQSAIQEADAFVGAHDDTIKTGDTDPGLRVFEARDQGNCPPILAAHKGAHDGQNPVEDTIGSMRLAIKQHAQSLEYDKRKNKAHHWYIIHNATPAEVSNDQGSNRPIAQMTDKQVHQIKLLDGSHIPSNDRLVKFIARYKTMRLQSEWKEGKYSDKQIRNSIRSDKRHVPNLDERMLYTSSDTDILIVAEGMVPEVAKAEIISNNQPLPNLGKYNKLVKVGDKWKKLKEVINMINIDTSHLERQPNFIRRARAAGMYVGIRNTGHETTANTKFALESGAVNFVTDDIPMARRVMSKMRNFFGGRTNADCFLEQPDPEDPPVIVPSETPTPTDEPTTTEPTPTDPVTTEPTPTEPTPTEPSPTEPTPTDPTTPPIEEPIPAAPARTISVS